MKKVLTALAAIAAVMLLCPWATVTFAAHDAGMAICFLLFFGLNPLCSLGVGAFSGLAVRQRWYLPFANGAAFLLGTWLLFEPGEPAFLRYGAAYLAVGLTAMLITVLIQNIRMKC